MELITRPSRNSLLLRAVINIIFGALLVAFPGLSLLILAYAFAINVLIMGLFMIFEPAVDSQNKHAVLTIIFGLLAVGAGIFVMSRPLVGIVVISYLIVAWALLYGLIDLFLGFKLTDSGEKDGWIFVIVGVLSIIFAIYLAFNPLEGSLALVWVVGLYAMVVGIALAYQAYKLKPSKKPKKGKK